MRLHNRTVKVVSLHTRLNHLQVERGEQHEPRRGFCVGKASRGRASALARDSRQGLPFEGTRKPATSWRASPFPRWRGHAADAFRHPFGSECRKTGPRCRKNALLPRSLGSYFGIGSPPELGSWEVRGAAP